MASEWDDLKPELEAMKRRIYTNQGVSETVETVFLLRLIAQAERAERLEQLVRQLRWLLRGAECDKPCRHKYCRALVESRVLVPDAAMKGG